jgi:hypothetical protein
LEYYIFACDEDLLSSDLRDCSFRSIALLNA